MTTARHSPKSSAGILPVVAGAIRPRTWHESLTLARPLGAPFLAGFARSGDFRERDTKP